MAEEQPKNSAENVHRAAQDDKDVRSDVIVSTLLEMVNSLQSKVIEHMASERVITSELVASIARVEGKADSFIAAFPDNDCNAHRVYHELLIAEARYKKEFWRKMLFELGRVGIVGFLLWAAYALWKTFLLGPK